MIYIIAPQNKRLVWYLAMEEYLAQHVGAEPLFFSWVVSPTVIFGRHQVMEDEVNIPYCREHDIATYRRKSGGGCVFADRGNLMLSYITPSTHSEEVFQEYLDMISNALRALGFHAVKSEHNDILIDGHKVSGNACYALPTGTIVHGTLLYNVNFSMLQQAITPSREKLAKHGVQSVRQRVVNLMDLEGAVDIHSLNSIETLAAYFSKQLCSLSRMLTPREIADIDAIEQTYLEPTFIGGNRE